MNEPETNEEAPKPDEKKVDVEALLSKMEQRLAAAEAMARDAADRAEDLADGDTSLAASDDYFDMRPRVPGGEKQLPAATEGQIVVYTGGEWVPAGVVEGTFITDVRVDASTMKIEKKTRTAKVIVLGTESGWVTIHTGDAC